MKKLLLGLVAILTALGMSVCQTREKQTDSIIEVEMLELYYELKLDYYEELYGVDLDDTPEDFVKFIYDNYRELYDYLMEE